MPGTWAAIQNKGSAQTLAKASKPEARAPQKREQSFTAAPRLAPEGCACQEQEPCRRVPPHFCISATLMSVFVLLITSS